MNIANCRLITMMGLALRPWLPPLDVKSAILTIIIINTATWLNLDCAFSVVLMLRVYDVCVHHGQLQPHMDASSGLQAVAAATSTKTAAPPNVHLQYIAGA